VIPYSNSFIGYIYALLLLPAIILGLKEKPIKRYGLVATLIGLYFLFGFSQRIIFFFVIQFVLIFGYSYLHKKYKSRWLLRLMILFSISPLVLVKLSPLIDLKTPIAFLGISYLTFRTVQMLIEIYDGLITKINPFEFTYFLLFLPTISSGPIDRSRRFKQDLDRKMTKAEYVVLLREGIHKIFCGIGYKFIIAALISTYWINKIPNTHTLLNTWNYMYSYSLYLFFDFAGYSLLAIGTSYLLGIKTPENFNKPFISRDIKEFWTRWHISLSFWFRDFLYTRLVMLFFKKKLLKNKYDLSYIAYLITMGTMGIWHGLEIHYILYGLYHGILLALTDHYQRKSAWFKSVKNNRMWNIVFVIITFHLICFGFLIFSGYLFK
jgi:membrane protein involved in D-alanine export